MRDIFIAHVEEDYPIALEIACGLEEEGYTTWCHEIDSTPGASYLIQTGQAIEEAKAVALVISTNSLSSRQVTKEVVRAHETGKVFVPLLVDITHMEFQNRQPEWREAIGAATSIRIPQEGVSGILGRVVSGLKSLDISPSSEPDAARIHNIRKVMRGYHPASVSPRDVVAPDREDRDTVVAPSSGTLSAASIVGACVSCGRFVRAEDKTVLGGEIYCNPCVEKMLSEPSISPAQASEKVTYNIPLRVVSGIFGTWVILGVIQGLRYFAESRLVSELIVDIISLMIAVACFMAAFVPRWVSANLRIKLEKGSVFGIVIAVLVILYVIAVSFGPEPPGGWWDY
ncbi:MAG: toll/interleukin-1 receptor domain-containing protein [Gammaproteobacteria bacterium]|nr:toll/interleukin-1 receptor domain-containing protein [Gammaproteobacteria bacterium]